MSSSRVQITFTGRSSIALDSSAASATKSCIDFLPKPPPSSVTLSRHVLGLEPQRSATRSRAPCGRLNTRPGLTLVRRVTLARPPAAPWRRAPCVACNTRPRCGGHWRRALWRIAVVAHGLAASFERTSLLELRLVLPRVVATVRTVVPLQPPKPHGRGSPPRCWSRRPRHRRADGTAPATACLQPAPRVRPRGS